MTKLDLLQKYYDMACHNLMCYSQTMLMTAPKEGFDKEWKQANEECKLLEEMIEEEKRANHNNG